MHINVDTHTERSPERPYCELFGPAKEFRRCKLELLDQVKNRGMVTRGRNLWDQVLLVTSRVLISKTDVIRGFWGAISLFFMFERSYIEPLPKIFSFKAI